MKRSNRIIFLALLSSLLLFSCASPLEKKLKSGDPIRFKGAITPIRIPVQFEYKPAKASAVISTVSIANYGGTKDKTKERIYFDYQLTELGKQLLWDIKAKKIKTGHQTFAPNIPIIEARILTDVFGQVAEFEISAPALEKYNVEQTKIDEIENKVAEALKKNYNSYPNTPVKSGDIVATYPKKDLEELCNEMVEIDPASIHNISEIKDIHLKLKGWGYYKEKKALIVTVEDYQSIDYLSENLQFSLDIEGFVILDAATHHRVYSEVVIKFRGLVTMDNENGNIEIYSWGNYTATIK